MKHKTFGAWLVIVLVFALVVSACGGSGDGGGVDSPPGEGAVGGGGSSGGGGASEGSGQNAYGVPDPSAEELGGLQFPLVDKPIELTIFSELDAKVAATTSAYHELPVFEVMEEKTGVKVTFRHPPSGMEDEQFNLMIGANELTDIISYNWLLHYPGGPSKALDDGVIRPLNDLVEQYAPNLKRKLEENPDFARQVMSDEGILYMFPFNRADEWQRYFFGPMLRQDWLDAVGLDVPTTMDEWYEVLTAFKEQDPGGTGNVIPFGGEKRSNFHEAGPMMFMNHWGLVFDYFQIDGEVHYGPYEPEYLEFLTEMNRWYREGLLDPEFASTDANQFRTKVTTHRMGAFSGLLNGGFGTLTGMMQDDPNFELVGAPYPAPADGSGKPYNIWHAARGIGGGGAALAGTIDEEKAIIAVKWLDVAHSEWGHNLFNFGIEGITYEWVDGFPKYTDEIMNNPDWPVAEALGKWSITSSSGRWFDQDGRYYEQMMITDKQTEAAYIWADADISRLMPLITPTVEESERLSRIENEIFTYAEEMAIKFIVGNVPLSEFDNYIAQLRQLGIEEAIQIRQAATDRYYQR